MVLDYVYPENVALVVEAKENSTYRLPHAGIYKVGHANTCDRNTRTNRITTRTAYSGNTVTEHPDRKHHNSHLKGVFRLSCRTGGFIR